MSKSKKQDVVFNKDGARDNTLFIKCCELASIPATARQYSKYKRGFGLAIIFKLKAKTALKANKTKSEVKL